MKRHILILSGVTVLLFALILTINSSATPFSNLKVSYINVGQGDSALIQENNGFDILIDGGKTSACLAFSMNKTL
jgi:beta-lactamase superfamily II metal-dependent hydrolase